MSKKKPQLTQEELESERIAREVNDIGIRAKNGLIPKNPTRSFTIGEQVRIGALQNITVTEVLFDGLAYRISCDYIGSRYGQPVRIIGQGAWDWTSVFPLTSFKSEERLEKNDDIKLCFHQSDISALLHMAYHSGVNFNPEYQRELVWTQDQKESLIESIFNNVDIGKFTFIKTCGDPYYYEILDGKQRLTTLCEFYENRFMWREKRFTDLHGRDANHFKSFSISWSSCSEMTTDQIYRLFIKMNTSGTPMSKEHLDKIKSLIK